MDNHDHNHNDLNIGLLVGMVLLARHDNNRPEWGAVIWGTVIGLALGVAMAAFAMLGR